MTTKYFLFLYWIFLALLLTRRCVSADASISEEKEDAILAREVAWVKNAFTREGRISKSSTYLRHNSAKSTILQDLANFLSRQDPVGEQKRRLRGTQSLVDIDEQQILVLPSSPRYRSFQEFQESVMAL